MSGRRWQQIDPLLKKSLLLGEDDLCFYYLVRTSGGFSASLANSRIENFKKDPARFRDRPDVWRYKTGAVSEFANDLRGFLVDMLPPGHRTVALVPMPTSKPRSHEHYDSRLVDMCRQAIDGYAGDAVLEDVLDVAEAIPAAHEGGSRDVCTLMSRMTVGQLSCRPSVVFLVDDVITTGAHYLACKQMIQRVCVGVPIVGVFLAVHKSDMVDYDYDFTDSF